MSDAVFDHTKKAAHIVKASKKIVDYLLSLNINNRTIKKEHTKWLVASIKKGEFVFTGNAIGVSTKGALTDGQHRLTAIREAGYPPVELLVVTGLDDKAMIYIDQNARRSIADMLRIVLDRPISSKVAALVNLHIKLKEDDEEGFVIQRNRRPDLEAVVENTDEHGVFLTKLIGVLGQYKRAAIATAIFHLSQKYDQDAALDFARMLGGDGDDLEKSDPAFHVRSWIKRYGTHGRGDQLTEYRIMVTALVAFANGKKLDKLLPSDSWEGLPAKVKPRKVKSRAKLKVAA